MNESTNGEPNVDDVAKAVARSLQADAKKWNVDDTDRVLSRGDGEHKTIITVGDDARGITVRSPGAGLHYKASNLEKGIPNDSQTHIWTAYKAWQSDRMAERLNYMPPEPEPEPDVSADEARERALRRSYLFWACASVPVALFCIWAGLAITTASASFWSNMPPWLFAGQIVVLILGIVILILGSVVSALTGFYATGRYGQLKGWWT